jgi:hypothetical protein
MALLDSVSKNMPVANAQLAQQRRAAADLQLQKAVAAVPQTAGIGAAQQMGAITAQQQGQKAVAQAQQNVGQVQQAAGQAIQQQANVAQNQLALKQQSMQKQAASEEQQFAALAGQKKQELFDARKQFAEDEMGRKLLDVRQLADYARLNAESEEQLADYAQAAQQATDRDLQMWETAYKKIEQALQFEQQKSSQAKDHALYKELAEAKAAMEKEIQDKKNKAANRAQLFSTVGMIGGTAIGSLGGPAGAMAGGTIGSGAGTMAAGATE